MGVLRPLHTTAPICSTSTSRVNQSQTLQPRNSASLDDPVQFVHAMAAHIICIVGSHRHGVDWGVWYENEDEQCSCENMRSEADPIPYVMRRNTGLYRGVSTKTSRLCLVKQHSGLSHLPTESPRKQFVPLIRNWFAPRKKLRPCPFLTTCRFSNPIALFMQNSRTRQYCI